MKKWLDDFNPIVLKRLNTSFILFGSFICCILIYSDFDKYYLVHASPTACESPSKTIFIPERGIEFVPYPVSANTLGGAVLLVQLPNVSEQASAATIVTPEYHMITYHPITHKATCINMIVKIKVMFPLE